MRVPPPSANFRGERFHGKTARTYPAQKERIEPDPSKDRFPDRRLALALAAIAQTAWPQSAPPGPQPLCLPRDWTAITAFILFPTADYNFSYVYYSVSQQKVRLDLNLSVSRDPTARVLADRRNRGSSTMALQCNTNTQCDCGDC